MSCCAEHGPECGGCIAHKVLTRTIADRSKMDGSSLLLFHLECPTAYTIDELKRGLSSLEAAGHTSYGEA